MWVLGFVLLWGPVAHGTKPEWKREHVPTCPCPVVLRVQKLLCSRFLSLTLKHSRPLQLAGEEAGNSPARTIAHPRKPNAGHLCPHQLPPPPSKQEKQSHKNQWAHQAGRGEANEVQWCCIISSCWEPKPSICCIINIRTLGTPHFRSIVA